MLPMLDDRSEFDFSKAMCVPLGMASPLWLPFAAATSAGLAFWWMTRWTSSANLEAMMDAIAPPATMPALAELPTAEPVLEAAEAVAEQTEEVAEAAAEVMLNAADDAEAAVAKVVEAAPEAEPVPAPKKKAKPAPEAPLH